MTVAPSLLETLGLGLGWQAAAVWVVTRDSPAGRLHCAAIWTRPGLEAWREASVRLSLEVGVGLPGRVWKTRRPAWIDDLVEDDALHLAGFFGKAEAARMLLAAGASPFDYSTNDFANQPLHAAAAAGRHVEVCRVLLAASADVRATQHGGSTPLHEVAASGHVELVELFLSAGADPSAMSDDGCTPAEVADGAGHADVAGRLDEVGRAHTGRQPQRPTEWLAAQLALRAASQEGVVYGPELGPDHRGASGRIGHRAGPAIRLELAREIAECGRPDVLAVRLERVRRPDESIDIARRSGGIECVELGSGVGDERVDEFLQELQVAAGDLEQALEAGRVKRAVGRHAPTLVMISVSAGCAGAGTR